jgi:two-component system, chemotaxis family, CheB/CheR fusion protein
MGKDPSLPSSCPSPVQTCLVEDAVETLETLTDLLRAEGAEVTAATNAIEALEIAEKATEPYHLVISDLGMPGMDGYQLLKELRKHELLSSTPAIALSGFTRPSDVNRALESGYETHVRKPVMFDQFIAVAARTSKQGS